jgi:hydrogenase maturation protein HypF
MQIFEYPSKISQQILALGPESNGNFSIFKKGKIYFSEDFGDLLVDANFNRFKKELNLFLKKEQIKPDVILTDLHPLYKATLLGEKLGKKFKAQHIQIQHHIAHIYSQIFNLQIPNSFFGIALDGTGYGLDGKIWGGEVFKMSNKIPIERVGHLEDQVMIGGDLAIQEPARMLLSILAKFLSKKEVYARVKKYYSQQEFEVLYNQLQQNFNCVETSSTGRILDAVSLLLGFCTNERNYKHEPIELLEKNSNKPYLNLKPVILNNILMTTPLFEYLIKNIHKDKKRLAATAQLYIAQGLDEIIKLQTKFHPPQIFLSGGIANNKIISEYFTSKKNKAGIPSGTPAVQIPRGDAGVSFGQIVYYLSF